MGRPDVWIEMPDRDHREAWDAFYERFQFHASYPANGPAIREPADSVTFSLRPIFENPGAIFAAGAEAINAEALRAFVATTTEDGHLLALDWQHPAYWLRPHALAVGDAAWEITPFPNGDYYAFLTPDLTEGTFGHPWEQTLCVFGPRLVQHLVPALTTWLPILRRGATAGPG